MPSKNSLILPIILVTFGIGWLLTVLGVAPEIDWTWTLGLAVSGILLLVVLGIDKMTVVCAPVLIVASVLSLLRQFEILGLGVMVPLLIILTGLLLFVARKPSIPVPSWIVDSSKENE